MNEKEMHLRDYLRVIRKRRYLVYTILIISVTVVLITTLTATPLYEASTRLLIEKSENTPLLTNYGYVSYDPEFLDTQSQIIKSTSVAQKVVRILKLDENYHSYFKDTTERFSVMNQVREWAGHIISLISKKAGIEIAESSEENSAKDIQATSRANMIAAMIRGGIVIQPVRNTRVVDISFMSQSPVLASMVVNTVAKAYIEEILEMKMRSSGYAVNWMTLKAEEEREKLDKSENALQEYMRAKDIVTIEDRIAIIPQRLSQVSSKLTIAEAKRKEVGAIYGKVPKVSMNLQEAETIPTIGANPALQSIRKQILNAEQHIVELSKKYGPKHPVMIRAKGDLTILKEKRDQEIGMLIKTLKNEYDLARFNEKSLANLLDRIKSEAVDLNEKFIQYRILKREVETNKNLYDALIARIKEKSATEQIKTVDVWVVDQAKTPEFPAQPRKKRNIMLGIIVGLFGGIGLAFFAEYLDNTIKSPDCLLYTSPSPRDRS